MAHTAHQEEPVPPPPMARPNTGLVGWALFGLAVAALLVYGFLYSRGPSLKPSVPVAPDAGASPPNR